jgi:outer membrane protein OmpA-like peptidoglycan-associated protein
MAYFFSGDNEPGGFGCGADCSCKSCRHATANLSQVYEEEEAPKARPVAPKLAGWLGTYPVARAPASFAGPRLGRSPFGFGRSGWGFGFGQVPARAPWRTRLNVGATPQYLRFLNLDQFNWNEASLTPRLAQMVRQLAEHVRASWKSMQPIAFIRLVGHTDDTGPEKHNVSLGDKRAQAVKAALDAILKDDIISGRIRIAILLEPSPGESAPVADNRTNTGKSLNRRVDVFVAPPQPPPLATDRPIRLPTPEEAAGRVFRPETIEERINRILRTLPPPPLLRRSFSQVFWQRVDENLDSAMSRVGVPQQLRGKLKEGAHAAITRGAEAIFDQVLDAANMTGSVRDALKSTLRAALETPVR